MTADLPFLNPTHQPSTDTTTRPRGRGTAVRRRRTRRGAAGSVVLTAVVAAGVIGALGACSEDGPDSEVTAGGDANPAASIDPDTEWSDPILSADERVLTIMVGSAGPGDGPCNQNFTHEVVATDRSVTVAFDEQPTAPVPDGEDVGCADVFAPQRFDIDLDAPLGDREVFDGVRPEPQLVHRLGELVEVTTTPDGFTPREPSIVEGEAGRWSQQFHGDADWYVSVDQQPAATATTPEGTPTPVTVHGIEGTRYSGQMNGTMESIVWVEGDLAITVWGEMQGPPAFTHSTELLETAESVRSPAGD
jgi:hypothetical protein